MGVGTCVAFSLTAVDPLLLSSNIFLSFIFCFTYLFCFSAKAPPGNYAMDGAVWLSGFRHAWLYPGISFVALLGNFLAITPGSAGA